MRKIKGYVFIAKFGQIEPLFGMRIEDTEGDENWDNFECNGLVPYETLEQAREGAREFKDKRNLAENPVAKIEMQVAENAEEFRVFEKEKGLIVIMKDHQHNFNIDKLLGPIVHGKRCFSGTVPGAYLINNGFQPYDKPNGDMSPYDRALYLLREVNRQVDLPATLAKFKLEKV